MKLGSWMLPPFAMLAPMAGVSDRALRELAMGRWPASGRW